ncbi:MAG: chemotaxis protein CheC [Methylococcales bacterium]|nr:chemotaxis protein CheC [Methylococcales bacterium]
MSDKEPILDDFYVDAVAEVLNVGMGSAAAALSEMINDEVNLSVPGVEFVSRLEATHIIGSKAKTNVSGVHQNFQGAFGGDAMLLFPEEQSLELVRAVLQQDDMALQDLTDMEQEAMTEIGNVILNACLCSMADMFGKEMLGDIPEFVEGSLAQVFSTEGGLEQTEAIVLLLNMDFAVDTKSIQGYVTFLMDVNSVGQFKANIEALLGM